VVVIGILMIMARDLVGGDVAARHLCVRVSNANDRFLIAIASWAAICSACPATTHRRDARKELAILRCTASMKPAPRKCGAAAMHNGHLVIASESIEAIRATMDSVLVRENQALSRSMVMLTIAISGGPFLGLLGTVVGVMITFAAIAAAGDVNVNAIAPGISAALLATVAGLFVAIPALFGYNYLLIRNKTSPRTCRCSSTSS
jgi:biopolymer transport protein ExbB